MRKKLVSSRCHLNDHPTEKNHDSSQNYTALLEAIRHGQDCHSYDGVGQSDYWPQRHFCLSSPQSELVCNDSMVHLKTDIYLFEILWRKFWEIIIFKIYTGYNIHNINSSHSVTFCWHLEIPRWLRNISGLPRWPSPRRWGWRSPVPGQEWRPH